MKTDIVRSGLRTAVVRSRNRKTAIIEAQYSKVLRKAYPEAEVYEIAMLQVPMPLGKSDDNDPEMGAYIAATASARVRNPVGAELSQAMNLAVPIMARFVEVQGAPFSCDNRMTDTDVEVAFKDFLDEDEPNTGFWAECVKRINALDEPSTSVAVAPPSTLTESETKDPLFVEPEQTLTIG